MIDTNKKYIFLKSGCIVKPLSKEVYKYKGVTLWQVKRVDTGKKMIVPEESLQLVN